MQSKISDQVIIVNDADQQIGVMDKVEAHRGEGVLHRASSVFLQNNKGEWLIQKRSQNKFTCPGWWANTCCGNLQPGESYEECAVRRLKQELGIEKVQLHFVDKFMYFARCDEEFCEREIDSVYRGVYEGPVIPNPVEVEAYRWISSQDLLQELEQDETSVNKKFVPWLKIIIKEKKLISEFAQ
jgi:isopentenyl-diphosphate delta-isomerase